MKKQVKFILALLGIAVFFLGTSFLYQFLSDRYDPQNVTVTDEQGDVSGDSSESSTQPMPAPNFTVYTEDGTAVKLSELYGKPIILNFWASWCPPCKSEMPDFESMYQKYGEDIHFVMINLTDGQRETVESGAAYVEAQGFTFPVYIDSDLDAATNYPV